MAIDETEKEDFLGQFDPVTIDETGKKISRQFEHLANDKTEKRGFLSSQFDPVAIVETGKNLSRQFEHLAIDKTEKEDF